MLTQERINYYLQMEQAINFGVTEPWVLGHGYYHERIAEFLADCLAHFSGDAVEIGCLHGACSQLLAPVCEQFGRYLLCIDPWDARRWAGHDWGDPWSDFSKVMRPWVEKGTVQVVRATSQSYEAFDAMESARKRNGLAFAFVDGSHDYPDVLIDLNNTMEMVSGLIVVDDWFSNDVKRATRDALANHPEWKIVLNQFPDFAEVYLMKGEL